MSEWDERLKVDGAFDPFSQWMPTPAEHLTPERAAARRLADATRKVVDRLTGTTASAEELEAVAEALEQALAGLEAGVTADGPGGEQGFAEAALAAMEPHRLFERSPFSGRANPVAPPMDMWLGDGTVEGRVTCGRTYEGPPGHVHGGVIAGMFDEMLGAAQGLSGKSGMTGRLTVHYRSPTPLGVELRLSARVARAEGRKIIVHGTLHAGDTLCAEAEGLFIAIDTALVEHLRALLEQQG